MPRYAFKIEYDGGPFSGWQRQTDLQTVQGSIEDAIAKLEPDHGGILGAGRTDTGVHATGQVAHVDLKKDWQAERLRQAINHHLKPAPISLTQCAQTDEDFHARFSAIERSYRFEIVSRRSPIVRDRGFVWHLNHRLDLAAMQEAAQYLIGKHDFTTFRSTMCQAKSPIKTLDKLEITAEPYLGDGEKYVFSITARSFLHNQVRSFVGTIERVGAGSWDPLDVKSALEARERAACGPVSPPQGLCLTDVKYSKSPF